MLSPKSWPQRWQRKVSYTDHLGYWKSEKFAASLENQRTTVLSVWDHFVCILVKYVYIYILYIIMCILSLYIYTYILGIYKDGRMGMYEGWLQMSVWNKYLWSYFSENSWPVSKSTDIYWWMVNGFNPSLFCFFWGESAISMHFFS